MFPTFLPTSCPLVQSPRLFITLSIFFPFHCVFQDVWTRIKVFLGCETKRGPYELLSNPPSLNLSLFHTNHIPFNGIVVLGTLVSLNFFRLFHGVHLTLFNASHMKWENIFVLFIVVWIPFQAIILLIRFTVMCADQHNYRLSLVFDTTSFLLTSTPISCGFIFSKIAPKCSCVFTSSYKMFLIDTT